MEHVDPARMKTVAAILRDPYSVHWDRAGNEALCLQGRVINQGPLNLGYIVNMLLEWAGPSSIRRLTVSFGRPVLDGDRVTAGGRVDSVDSVDSVDAVDAVDDQDDAENQHRERRATCTVWLKRDDEILVSGTAIVAIDSIRRDS